MAENSLSGWADIIAEQGKRFASSHTEYTVHLLFRDSPVVDDNIKEIFWVFPEHNLLIYNLAKLFAQYFDSSYEEMIRHCLEAINAAWFDNYELAYHHLNCWIDDFEDGTSCTGNSREVSYVVHRVENGKKIVVAQYGGKYGLLNEGLLD